LQKLLIANRGEIAVRIIRTAKDLGLATVVVCSEADLDSLAVQMADEFVVIGPAPAKDSYLNQEAVLRAARDTGADAVHPGFGFLSENAEFAHAVVAAGLIWVGPSAEVISLMGDKVAALRAAKTAGVPVLAGTEGALSEDADSLQAARAVGYPLMIKASAGGGGRGIRVVHSDENFLATLNQASTEAQAAFGDGTVYLERFVEHARHVEVQIVGDGVNYIHLGDRDCSMQRRSQKVLEEAPAPDLPEEVRKTIRESSVRLAEECGYTGVGTVEFLYDPAREEAAFIEMNTRLQVEHPVTEMITGLDLVELQLRIASGKPLGLKQTDVTFDGHAFECRINAENPSMNFFPSPGTIHELTWARGEGVRIDAGVVEGSEVVPFYDSMIAKLVVHGATRTDALSALSTALDEVNIQGISTTVPLHRILAQSEELAEVTHHTTFIENTPRILEALEKV
jgi:acetyl-CoA carboxylase biotin carboxylase subunit